MNFSRCTAVLFGLAVLLISNALESDVSGDDDGFRLTRVDGSTVESSDVSVDSQGRVTGAFEDGSLPIDELVLFESIGAESIDSPSNAGGPKLYFVAGGLIDLAAPVIDG